MFFVFRSISCFGALWIKPYPLDAQHKRLIEYYNRLHEAMEAGKEHEAIEEVLNNLIVYTNIHFGREEQLMEEYKFSELENHKLQHKELVEEVLKLHRLYSKDNMGIVAPITLLLDKWLRDHILTQDKKYGKYFDSKDAA